MVPVMETTLRRPGFLKHPFLSAPGQTAPSLLFGASRPSSRPLVWQVPGMGWASSSTMDLRPRDATTHLHALSLPGCRSFLRVASETCARSPGSHAGSADPEPFTVSGAPGGEGG